MSEDLFRKMQAEQELRDRGMVPKSELKNRGWTEALIKALLGEPDKIYAVKAGDKRKHLYYVFRVEAAEDAVRLLAARLATKPPAKRKKPQGSAS